MDIKLLTGIFLLALAVEGFVEYFVAQPLKQLGKETWWVRYVALVPGVGMGLAYHADLPGMVGLTPAWPVISWIVTGVIISRGANYISDLLGQLVDLIKRFANE